MESLVEVESLRKSFGDNVAVRDVSFTMSAGEMFGLLGPNGAGKTTIVRMLTTLIKPDRGRAMVCGFDVLRQPARVREFIGYVPQALSADGSLTGYENMLILAKLAGLRGGEMRQRIAAVLASMQLEDAAGRVVGTYSGGMVRRLEIGQAILHYPRVLFLDEPTVGLDPVARRTVWDKLDELSREYQMAVLITTHYMEEAEALCSRVAILNHGEMVVTGSPAELKEKIGRPDASLDEVFSYFTGNNLEEGGNYRELRQVRRTSRRLG